MPQTYSNATIACYRVKLRKARKAYPLITDPEMKKEVYKLMLHWADVCGMEMDDPRLDRGPGRPRGVAGKSSPLDVIETLAKEAKAREDAEALLPTDANMLDVLVPADARERVKERDPEDLKWVPGTPEYEARLKRVAARAHGEKLDEEILTLQANREAKAQDEAVKAANEHLAASEETR